jgi:hypothetical protein
MHRYSVSLLSLLILGVLLSPAFSQPPLRLAISVMNLTPGGGITAGEAVLLTDRLLVELARTTRFEVTERAQRDEILKEQAFQQTGVCDEASCLAKVGKLLGVQKMVGGSVGRMGKAYSVILRMVDMKTGSIEQTAVKDYPGNIDYLVTTAMKDVAWQLARGGLTPAEQRELAQRQKEAERLEEKKRKEEARLAKEQEEKRMREAELARLAEQKTKEERARKAERARRIGRRVSWGTLALGCVAGAGAAYEWKAGGDALQKYNSATDEPTITSYRQKVKNADLMTHILTGVSAVILSASGFFFFRSRGSKAALSEANRPVLYLGMDKDGRPGAMLVMRFE